MKELKIPVFALVLTLALAGLATATEKNKNAKVEWKDLPPAVQKTITQHAKGGIVGDIQRSSWTGEVKYEARIKGSDGKIFEVEVAADGKFLRVE